MKDLKKEMLQRKNEQIKRDQDLEKIERREVNDINESCKVVEEYVNTENKKLIEGERMNSPSH